MSKSPLSSLVWSLGTALALTTFAMPAEAANPRPRPGQKKPPEATPEPAPTPAEAPGDPVLQRSNRMELDARVVRGETARSGAVYLFQRAPRRLPPLVGLSQSYLDDIVVPVLGPDALAAKAPVPVEEAPAPVVTPVAPTKPVKPRGGR